MQQEQGIDGAHREGILLAIAVLALSVVFVPVLVQSLLYLVRIGLSTPTFAFGVVLGIAVPLLLLPKDRYTGIGYALVLLVTGVALSVQSVSWDGANDSLWYHEPAIVALSRGANPVYDTVGNFWADHYPKAVWIFSAGVYRVFGNIESAKVITVLVALACFGMTAFILLRLRVFPAWLSYAAAALIAANPVTLMQLDTHYVDGILADLAALLLVVAMAADLGVSRLGMPKRDILAVAIASAVLLVNVKLTGLVLVIGLLALHAGRAALAGRWSDARWRRAAILTVAVLFAGSLVVGFSPYVTNWVHDGNPLYPVLGADQTKLDDGPYAQRPKPYRDKPAPVAFVMSLTDATSSGTDATMDAPYRFKVPVGMSAAEWESVKAPDPRRGGFGPLFLLALLVSVLALPLLASSGGRRGMPRSTVAYLLIASTLLTLALIEAWWARFAPVFFLVPVLIALGGSCSGAEPCLRTRLLTAMSAVVVAVLMVNAVVIASAQAHGYLVRRSQRQEVLALLSGGTVAQLRFPDPWQAENLSQSLAVRLLDLGYEVELVPYYLADTEGWHVARIMDGEIRIR